MRAEVDESKNTGVVSHRTGWAFSSGFAALWAAAFGSLGVNQFLRFHAHAFDLGIFAQGTYLLGRFQQPFVTVRGLNLFADHSSYILVMIVPVYVLFPSATTLIVITVLALAASSLVAFGIAKNAGAGQWIAFAVSALVLISPAVEWQVRDTFHPEVLVIPLALFAVWLLQRDRDGWAIAMVIIALTAKEDVGLLMVPLGLAVVWLLGKRRTGWIIAGAGLGAFVVNFFILLPAWSPTGELLYSYRYAELGDTPGGIVVGLLTSPDVWLRTLTDPTRIWYVAALVLAMPLAILGWRWLLVGLPGLAANVFSTHGYQYEIPWHYTAYLIVVVAIAAAHGAARWQKITGRMVKVSALVVTLIVPCVIWIAAAPVSVWAKPHEHRVRIAAMLDVIPPDESVSAWTTLVPHLANRKEVYLFPNPFEEFYYGTNEPDLPTDAQVEWVAIRLDSYRDYDRLIASLTDSGAYEVFWDDPPFRLLKRVP
jgi:uncharacterized membrane protein